MAKLAEFCFDRIDPSYHERALQVREAGGHAVVGGENYGQGSSREHAALAPRYLGLRLVLAKSFARIHWQNLANFGILALTFADPADYDRVAAGDVLVVDGVREALAGGHRLVLENTTRGRAIEVTHALSPRQVEMVLAGSVLTLFRRTREDASIAAARHVAAAERRQRQR